MESQLEAFIVKRNKILLPAIEVVSYRWINPYWVGVGRKEVSSEILIEPYEYKRDGYRLYGTEIPIIFSHKKFIEMTDPVRFVCIGVKTRQWDVSMTEKKEDPNCTRNFEYSGKRIIDNQIIEWLEQEKNIESMKKVREWALEYGKQLKMYKECEQSVDVRMELNRRIKQIRDTDLQKDKNPLIERNNELVKKYQ